MSCLSIPLLICSSQNWKHRTAFLPTLSRIFLLCSRPEAVGMPLLFRIRLQSRLPSKMNAEARSRLKLFLRNLSEELLRLERWYSCCFSEPWLSSPIGNTPCRHCLRNRRGMFASRCSCSLQNDKEACCPRNNSP